MILHGEGSLHSISILFPKGHAGHVPVGEKIPIMKARSCFVIAWFCLLNFPVVFHSAGQVETPASDQAPIELPGVIVQGEDGSLTVPTFAQAMERMKRIPGGMDLISGEEVRRGRASTLTDVLGFSPGVFVQERFGAEEARLSIRGSGLQRTFHGRGLMLLQDGVPVNLADGGFDFQVIEPLAVKQVEVYRGANALQFGSSTLGGAIQYVTPTGRDAARLQLRAEGGSYGHLRGQVASGGVEGRLDYYASVTHFSYDGYQDHALQQNQRFFGNLGYRLSDSVETRWYFTAVETDSELPGSITRAQLESNPRQANANNLAGDYKRDFELYRVANKTTWKGDAQQLDLSLWWSTKDLRHPIPILLDQYSNDLGLNVHHVSESTLMGLPQTLTLGLRQTGGWVEDNRFPNSFPGNFVNFLGPAANAPLSRDTTAFNTEIYMQEELEVTESLTAIAGLQFIHATRRTARQTPLVGGVAAGRLEFTGFNPRGGLIYEPSENMQWFANVSRSYEPPSFGEISPFLIFPGTSDFLNLKAQSATTLEVGTRGERGFLSWDLAFYHAWVDDELLSLNNSLGAPLGTINATATRHFGLEAGLDARLSRGLVAEGDQVVLRQMYNWSRFVFASDPVYGNNRLAGIPEHFHRAELMYEHPRGLYFGPTLEWAATKSPIDHANSFFTKPYALVGAKMGWRSRRGFSFFVEGRNLADKTYASTTGVVADALGADSANFFPGLGRSVYAGVEWSW